MQDFLIRFQTQKNAVYLMIMHTLFICKKTLDKNFKFVILIAN